MTMKRALCLLLTLLLVCTCFLSSCDDKNDTSSGLSDNSSGSTEGGKNNNNTNGKPDNSSQTNGDDLSTDEEDSDYIKIKTLANTIRQENKENDVNIILENDKMALTVDELFSYTNKYTVDIYALSGSSIDYAKKEMSLNVGYNHFQIKFKNLSDYSEIFFDIEVFRDPGIVNREFNRYFLNKEITTSTGENGLPKYDLKISITDGVFTFINVNGEKIPAQVVECNIKVNFYADFYIDAYMGDRAYAQYNEFVSATHTFRDVKETFETTINFSENFWNDVCSKYPYATLENSRLGLYDRYPNEFYIYEESYISLRVDYSQYQFD